MLKKIICIFICLFSLTACVTNDMSDFETVVSEAIKSAVSTKTNVGINNITKYFSYYLPKDMTEDICEETYVVFDYIGCPIVLNLNISSMINKKYFTDVALTSDDYFDSEKLLCTLNGTFSNKKGTALEYLTNIYYRDDSSVYIEFVTPIMSYHSICQNAMLSNVIKHIVLLAQYVEVSTELVLKDYYDRDLIDYKKKTVDLFDRIVPANGRLEEMVIEK